MMTLDAISARLRELRAQVIRECCLIEGELRRFAADMDERLAA